jgi:hypothetical protein
MTGSAKQSSVANDLDCFVANAPRNDGCPGNSNRKAIPSVRILDIEEITVPDVPGIGFEGKSDLYREVKVLAA